MLTYSFEGRGEVPLYDMLYRNIKKDIVNGKLKSEEKLPSKRSLAQHLKLSVVTIEGAYAQLIMEGYIYAIEKKGYFVSSLQEVSPNPPKEPKIYSSDTNPVREYFGDLKTNSIYSEKFPFSTWTKLMRKILSEQDKALLDATPYNGVVLLRSAIAEYLYRFRGMDVSPSQIVVGAGTEYLYGMLIQLLGRDCTYALENPGYKKIAKIYACNDVACEFIGMDEKGLSVLELRDSAADIAHISPSHHFPTGVVMPIGRRHELLAWGNEKDGRYLIEDDYDSEFRFTGRPIQTLQSIDENEKVIYMNTFSKTIAPSIRISYMVLPDHLAERYNENLSFYSCTVPSFEQYTLAKFISEGYFEQHINRMRMFYKKQRDLIIHELNRAFTSDRLTILEEDAGLHFLMKVETEKSDREIVEAAAQEGVKLSCLSEYFYSSVAKEEGTVILNYSGIHTERIEEVVDRLARVFD